VRVVAGARIAPPVYRCLGTVDIDGNGTDCDITHAGPFILGDVVTMAKMDMFRAPFCAHPHSGATVCSVLMEGKPFRAWDNVRGAEAELLLPGGVYMLDSGYGCVHDEKPDPISLAPVTRAVFAEGESAIGEGFSFLQLWFNPGNLHQLDSKPMSSQVLSPSEVPVITDGPLSLRLLAGKHGGAESPLALPHELVLMHGRLQGGNKSSLQLPPGHEGFIVLVKDSGAALVAGQALEHGHTGCIIGGEDAPLELQAASEAPVFFVLVRAPTALHQATPPDAIFEFSAV
jgi:redox-sensitive bicupin YhaK (pirin superfamily)